MRGHSTIAVATAAADTGNLRFYQLAGFRLRTIERDAFTPGNGYPRDWMVDGIPLRDRVWLDLPVRPGRVMTHAARDRIVAPPRDLPPVGLSDAELYRRGVQTLLGAW